MLQVPGVARVTEEGGLAAAGAAELGAVGFAHDHQPGGLIAADHRAGVVGDVVAIEARAVGGYGALQHHAQVLEQERHAVEGARRQGFRNGCARPVVECLDDAVQCRVHCPGPRNGGLQHFRC